MRRVFYPASPYDVLKGFLAFVLTGGLVAFIGYGIFFRHTGGGAIWLSFKAVPLALAGLATMLYRERVVLDTRDRELLAQRSVFVVPIGSSRYSFRDVRGLHWVLNESKQYELKLTMSDSRDLILARQKQPDEALLTELRGTLGLQDA